MSTQTLKFRVDGIEFVGQTVKLKKLHKELVSVEVIGNWPFSDDPPKRRTVTLSRKYIVGRGNLIFEQWKAVRSWETRRV